MNKTNCDGSDDRMDVDLEPSVVRDLTRDFDMAIPGSIFCHQPDQLMTDVSQFKQKTSAMTKLQKAQVIDIAIVHELGWVFDLKASEFEVHNGQKVNSHKAFQVVQSIFEMMVYTAEVLGSLLDANLDPGIKSSADARFDATMGLVQHHLPNVNGLLNGVGLYKKFEELCLGSEQFCRCFDIHVDGYFKNYRAVQPKRTHDVYVYIILDSFTNGVVHVSESVKGLTSSSMPS